MKIGIYSDAHFSKHSSIFIGKHTDSEYSKRLHTLIKSFEWLYSVFSEQQADLIINCGDMTSSETIASEENSAIAKALSYNKGIPEIHLLGNHEIQDASRKFSSVDLIEGYAHCRVIRELTVIKDNPVSLIFIPYIAEESQLQTIQEKLLNVDYPAVVFSHINYLGEGLLNGNGFIDTNGIDKDTVFLNSNIRRIFNGHLHNPLEVSQYIQIGSLIGNGFGDSYSFSKPRILIYDTISNEIKSFLNPFAVLFYKLKVKNISELKAGLEQLDRSSKCLQVNCSLSLREHVSNYLFNNSEQYHIEDFRVKSEIESNLIQPMDKSIAEKIEKISDNKSTLDLLKLFTEHSEDMPASLPVMLHFLEKYFV